PTRLIDGDDRDELPGAIQVNDTIGVIEISIAVGVSVRLVNAAGDADRVLRLKAPNHINLFRGHRRVLRQWLQAGHLFNDMNLGTPLQELEFHPCAAAAGPVGLVHGVAERLPIAAFDRRTRSRGISRRWIERLTLLPNRQRNGGWRDHAAPNEYITSARGAADDVGASRSDRIHKHVAIERR